MIKLLKVFGLSALMLSSGLTLMAQNFTVVINGGERIEFKQARFEAIEFEDGHILTPSDTIPAPPVDNPDNPAVPAGLAYVDLGLESGTLWSNYNLGADSEQGMGYLFAWGETAEKESYTWDTYVWCNGGLTSLTKYCDNMGFGDYDDLTALEPSDDAATVLWGDEWCTPTPEQLQELKDNCEWTKTGEGENAGYTVTGPNGNSIFLPFAGTFQDNEVNGKGTGGYYWSNKVSMLCYQAQQLLLTSSGSFVWDADRRDGCSIRPVKK